MLATFGQTQVLQKWLSASRAEEDAEEMEERGRERYFGLQRILRTLAKCATSTSLRNDAFFALFLIQHLPNKGHWALPQGPILGTSNDAIAAKLFAVEPELRRKLGLSSAERSEAQLSSGQVTDRLGKLKARGWLVPHRPARNHARRFREVGGDPAAASRGFNFTGLLEQRSALEAEAKQAADRLADLERRRAHLLDVMDRMPATAQLTRVRRSLQRLRLTSPDAEALIAKRLQELSDGSLHIGLSSEVVAEITPHDSPDETTRLQRPQYKQDNLDSLSSLGGLSRGSERIWPSSPPDVSASQWAKAGITRSGFNPHEAVQLFPVLDLWAEHTGSWAQLQQLARLAARASGLSDALLDAAQRSAGPEVMSVMVCVTLQRLSDGDVTCGRPLPYFRSMLTALERGELNLSPTIYGYRAKAKARRH